MGRKIRVLLVVALLFAFWGTLPARSEAGGGWIMDIRVLLVSASVDSYVIDTDRADLSSCVIPYRIVIKADLPLSRSMYTNALSALLSGRKIAANIPDETACHQGGVLVNILAIHQP